MCHHLSEKGQKAGFWRPISSKIEAAKEKKGGKEKARKKKGGEEKKAMVALLVFIMATLAEKKKNCLTEAIYLVVTFSKIRQDINWDKSVLPLG